MKSGPRQSPTSIIIPDFFGSSNLCCTFCGSKSCPKVEVGDTVDGHVFHSISMLGGVFYPVEVSYHPYLVPRPNTWVRTEAIWVAMVSPWSLVVLAGNGARNHGLFVAEPVDTVKMRRTHHDFPKLLGHSPEIEWLEMLNYQAVSQSPNSKAPSSYISNLWGADSHYDTVFIETGQVRPDETGQCRVYLGESWLKEVGSMDAWICFVGGFVDEIPTM